MEKEKLQFILDTIKAYIDTSDNLNTQKIENIIQYECIKELKDKNKIDFINTMINFYKQES